MFSLISGIAEQPDLVKIVKNKAVADGSKSIAGKFKVIRLEIPATLKNLRDIICGRIEDFLGDEGISFSFPPFTRVTSVSAHKT